MSALNATIEEFRTISNNVNRPDNSGEGYKDDICFAMGAFEDFFVRFAEEKLNDASPKFTYQSNQFGKSIFWFVWEFLLKDVRFSTRCFKLKL